MLTEQLIEAIENIIRQGNDVEIQNRRNGIAVLAVKKDFKCISEKDGKEIKKECGSIRA